MKRVNNFYAGPSALPTEVMEKAQQELLDFAGTGMSVMEISHRSAAYDQVHNGAREKIRNLLGLDDGYHVLFLQGGASMQFAMVPMNLLGKGKKAHYLMTGTWSDKALKEAERFGVTETTSAKDDSGAYTRIPASDQIRVDPACVYCHITSNNTVCGTQWQQFPDTGGVPLVADMSSDILSRKMDVSPFGLIYAGAQKNLGPAGLAVVILRQDLLEQASAELPTLLRYATHVEKGSLFNTPPTFTVYMMNLVLEWILNKGGLEEMERRNREKANALYGLIDSCPDFFRSPVDKAARSLMNVVFRLPSTELESELVAEAEKNDFIGIKGHRSVGGIRVSMYNAAAPRIIHELVDFLKDFAEKKA